jgi:membrane associated rhomboid family serine protease
MFKNSEFNLLPSIRFTILMWLVFLAEQYFQQDFGFLGIYPREFSGLIGIFTAPLVHGNWTHLLSNTFPFMFLSGMIFIFYPKVAVRVFFQCYLITGILVWLFGRPFYHVGASGLIYGLAFFLISVGFLMKDFKSISISAIVLILYGGLFYGIFPTTTLISYESHLLGAIVGVATALSLFKVSKRKLK